jgi:hypothetical protein
MATGAVNPLDGPAQAPASRKSGVWDWLLPLLGLSSAAGGAAMRNRGGSDTPNGGPTSPKMRAQPRAIDADGSAIPEPWMKDQRRGVSDVVDMNERYLPGADAKLPAPNKRLSSPDSDYNYSSGEPNTRGRITSPQNKLTNNRPDYNYEGTGKEIEGVNARNQSEKTARKDVIQKKVDAENESAGRLQEQMKKRAADEAATADLINKAKRAVGRK